MIDASKIIAKSKKGILVKSSPLSAAQTPMKAQVEESKSPAKSALSTAEKSKKKCVSWDPLLPAKDEKKNFHAEDDANRDTFEQGVALIEQSDSEDEEEEEESELEEY